MTFFLAFAILLCPGLAVYVVMRAVMAWPWPTPLFPYLASDAVPMAVAKLAIGWWWAVLAAALLGAVAWDETRGLRVRRTWAT